MSPHIGLGVRRLSIIDLATGQQPISNEYSTVVLVFNGEIYNHLELRARLEKCGHRFTSRSDSEVIVHAYEEYGTRCVEHLNGMFAFALWDAPRRRLFLARDRLGIKPLYYWAGPEQLVFASELRALLAHPDVPREIDLVGLDLFLTLEYIPAPHTILAGVHKLPPGYWLAFENGQTQLTQYWDVATSPAPISASAAPERLAALMQDAVSLQLGSDVPLGAFLSGGLDSSSVVAFMSEITGARLQTFSIGLDEKSYDESAYAREVAWRYRSAHTEEMFPANVADLTEQVLERLDEPLADFSTLPTYVVSKLARRSVKAVLTGDGGDELFGGYDTYMAQRLERFYRWLPHPVRQEVLPALANRLPPLPAKKGIINKTKRFVEGAALPQSLQHVRWMIFLSDEAKTNLYQPELCHGLNGYTPGSILAGYFQRARQLDPLAQQQYVDLKTYLADNILAKVDRMSMAASLEARVPLLDHRIVEFALSLPPELKLNWRGSKILLRQAMRGRLPNSVLKKPKQGFSVPLKLWLQGPLRPMMSDLLSSETVRRQGYFQAQTVSRWIAEHLAGRVNHSHRLWALMVFERWRQGLRSPASN